nr:glycine zipper [uncultured bacterium]
MMMMGGIAGLLYARDLDKGYSPGALGGLLAGMVSVFVGLALAELLNAPPTFPLGVGTVIGTGIGAVGGVFGQMSANMRKVTGRF